MYLAQTFIQVKVPGRRRQGGKCFFTQGLQQTYPKKTPFSRPQLYSWILRLKTKANFEVAKVQVCSLATTGVGIGGRATTLRTINMRNNEEMEVGAWCSQNKDPGRKRKAVTPRGSKVLAKRCIAPAHQSVQKSPWSCDCPLPYYITASPRSPYDPHTIPRPASVPCLDTREIHSRTTLDDNPQAHKKQKTLTQTGTHAHTKTQTDRQIHTHLRLRIILSSSESSFTTSLSRSRKSSASPSLSGWRLSLSTSVSPRTLSFVTWLDDPGPVGIYYTWVLLEQACFVPILCVYGYGSM